MNERVGNDKIIMKRCFVTPLNADTGMSGKGSTMSYKVDDRMCHLIFTGCNGSVIFKFDPKNPEEAIDKLNNVQEMVESFREDFMQFNS